ncbi:hypothetical protein GH714_005603 [Hevea brasiliensis]|uniref:Uncharacterized protein n=1 Tax=Hevea brasiliensis TaxID=3981 RepID=A0A6A6KBS9_HEVBR|nr:hypothetical protein GH714_005603 [Hevea brasiliensis]
MSNSKKGKEEKRKLLVMDCFGSKKQSSNQCKKDLIALAEKVRLLQEEIKAIMCEREKEGRAYERDMLIYAFKEAEWKQEKKRLKEEVKRLRKMLEERKRRLKKWKVRDGLYWKAEEEDMIEELKMEVKAKEEIIEELKARLALVEREEYKRAREVDILRQSLRIVSSKNAPSFDHSKPKLTLVKQARKA